MKTSFKTSNINKMLIFHTLYIQVIFFFLCHCYHIFNIEVIIKIKREQKEEKRKIKKKQ